MIAPPPYCVVLLPVKSVFVALNVVLLLTFTAPPAGGTVAAIPSKSVAHRMLICAAFADGPTNILCPSTNNDIDATAQCLRALGAIIERTEDGFRVTPARAPYPADPMLDCGESGSTLRFLLPVALMRQDGGAVRFVRHGRLPERPLSPLYEELRRHGASLPNDPTTEPLPAAGPIRGGDFTLAANVSSQFISGLLMAFPLSDAPCTLTLTGKIESADYIRITTDVMRLFGAKPQISADERTYSLRPARYRSPGTLQVEGDWSNAAIWMVMGAIGQHPITVTGVHPDSPQGDRRIAEVLRAFGASVTFRDTAVTVSPAPLHGIRLDASQIPDLVPVIAAAACAAEGETVITGIERLRIKESDRAAAVTEMLTALGADIVCDTEKMTVRGGKRLHGGTVSSFKDHRMVMCAACASLLADGKVSVTDAQAIAKSYPAFTADLAALGGAFTESEV